MANIEYENRAANILRTTREASGKNQTEFAQLLGVHRKTLASWEQGITSPTFPDVIHWFDLLHLDGSIINKTDNDDILLSIRESAQEIVDMIDKKRSLKNETGKITFGKLESKKTN